MFLIIWKTLNPADKVKWASRSSHVVTTANGICAPARERERKKEREKEIEDLSKQTLLARRYDRDE